jgi:TRAP-type uncharacterized transport system fused permease subunit
MQGSLSTIATSSITSALGIAALAAGLSGWLGGPIGGLKRGILIAGGVLLCYPARWADLAGLAISAMVLFLQFPRRTPVVEPE